MKNVLTYSKFMAAGAVMMACLYLIARPVPVVSAEIVETVAETPEIIPETTTAECLTVPETEPVKTAIFETTTEPTTTAETTTETVAPETVPETSEPDVVIYSCHGIALPEDLQRLAFEELSSYGMAEYYPTFLCQAFQESSYQADQRTLNNGCYDCGLMQIREKYWSEWESEAGWSGDIMDAGDNVKMACYILSRYWIATGGDVAQTISMYMSGWSGEWQGVYVSDVLSHLDYLEVINGK